MKMKLNRKTIFGVILFIFIIVILLLVMYPHLFYSKQQIISLIERPDYTNYKLEIIEVDNNQEKLYATQYVKNNKVKTTYPYSDTQIYLDFESGKSWVVKEESQYFKQESDNENSKNYFPKSLIENFNNASMQYKFIKTEKYQDKPCIVFALNSQENSGQGKWWIDKETGVILKSEHSIDEKTTNTTLYRFQLNTVSDEDVNLPEFVQI